MMQQPVGLLKLMLNLFRTISVQWRELYVCNFIKYTFNIGLHQDTCEPICFKLGMMLGTTKLFRMIPIKVTFTISQGHRVIENLEFMQSFCCKVAWSKSDFRDG